MGYYKLSNSFLSKSYYETFLKKIDIFFIYSEISLKFCIKIERLLTTTTQTQKLGWHFLHLPRDIFEILYKNQNIANYYYRYSKIAITRQ